MAEARTVRAFLALGSNLGDRLGNLRRAVELLDAAGRIRVLRSSRVYETAPVGGPSQPDYLNAVLEVETARSPRGLLGACRDVERAMGRRRDVRWGPRVIDVDVLAHGDAQVDEPDLTIPHPRMHERAFVLAPLLELDRSPRLPGGRRLADLRPAEPPGAVRPVAPPLPAARAPAAGPPAATSAPATTGPGVGDRADDVAVVGCGRVATSVAVLLGRAGYRVVAASGRDASAERARRHLPAARFTTAPEAAAAGRIVILGVVDDAIEPACRELARAGVLGPDHRVLHLSGSAGLDVLGEAAAAGAGILAWHPLQSFPDVETGIARLPGSGVAVTAADEGVALLGERLARAVGARPFRLAEEVKPLYHAAAVFCANYLVTVEAVAEDLLRAAGLEDPAGMMAPLARTALDRTFEVGPGDALTGPAVRGDVGTLERNLRALADRAPQAVAPYLALARIAALIAARAGRLPEPARARVDETLDRWE